MKKLLFLLSLVVITLNSCVVPTENKFEIEQKLAQTSKLVVDKQAPIENRFSGGDFFFGSGSITKSQTVYYLIAEDGTMVEVDLKAYSRTKIGSYYQSYSWR